MQISPLSALLRQKPLVTIKRTAAKAFGATGSGTGFDVAVADHLQIGNTLLRNVAFMVYPDDSELFKAVPVGRRGLVGLPVLRELGEMQWNPNGLKPGVMRLGYTNSHAQESPNMRFDGSDPVTSRGRELEHGRNTESISARSSSSGAISQAISVSIP
jgi:hypothetical protein